MSAHEEREAIARVLDYNVHLFRHTNRAALADDIGDLAARVRSLPVADDAGELAALREAFRDCKEKWRVHAVPDRWEKSLMAAVSDLLAKRDGQGVG